MREAVLYLRQPTLREVIARRAAGDAAVRRLLSIPGGDALYAEILHRIQAHSGEPSSAVFRWLGELLDRYVARGDVMAAASILNLKGNLIKTYRFNPIEALRCHRQALRAFRDERANVQVAEALGDIGAVLLEAGCWRKVPRWWRASLNIADNARKKLGTHARQSRASAGLRAESETMNAIYASHSVDYAYIMALRNPTDRRNLSRFDVALAAARVSNDRLLLARALLNIANFVYFDHVGSTQQREIDRAYLHVAEAEQLTRLERADYMRLLVIYSRIAFRIRAGQREYSQDARQFRSNLAAFLPNVRPSDVGDVRLHNMARHSILNGSIPASVLPPRWRQSLGRNRTRDGRSLLARSERHNPYFRCGVYVTYY